MGAHRKPAESEPDRRRRRVKARKARRDSGIPALGLWECGIGSGWR